jgi:LmbE family N-acetylglucosaminyl deacetylase
MATLVCFHAHPDDEALSTAGLMVAAAAAGHRVVVVTATRGERGEPQPGVLAPGEELAERRVAELAEAAALLGADEPIVLGYVDSGMMGEETNLDPACFWQADVEEAASRLATVLRDVGADVLTVYDDHGLYGHPDHIQVHRVGCRAEELVRDRLPGLRVVESTMNRDELRRGIELARELGIDELGPEGDGDEFDPDGPMDDGNPMGTPEAELTLGVDVTAYVDHKRASIAAHRSQVSDSSFFLQMPPEMFAQAFGREWFIEHGRPVGLRMGWLFE